MKSLLTLLITLLTINTALAEPQIFHEEKVGNWNIQGYINDEKRFSHCVANINFPAANAQAQKALRANNVMMFFKWFESGNLGFALGGDEWKMVPQKTYNIGFKFSDGSDYNVDAVAADNKILAVEMRADGSGEWYTKFAKSEWVELLIEGSSLGKFNLSNSEKTLRVLYNCYLGGKEGQAQVDGEANGNVEGTFGAGRD